MLHFVTKDTGKYVGLYTLEKMAFLSHNQAENHGTRPKSR